MVVLVWRRGFSTLDAGERSIPPSVAVGYVAIWSNRYQCTGGALAVAGVRTGQVRAF